MTYYEKIRISEYKNYNEFIMEGMECKRGFFIFMAIPIINLLGLFLFMFVFPIAYLFSKKTIYKKVK